MEKNYQHEIIERQMQNLWEELKIYKFRKDKKGEIYSIDTPPPTVSGSLHIGHIFSYTQAEMIARFKRMQGYNVFYPFGFDDNGLPTERLVEKDESIMAKDLPRSEFIEKCISITDKYESEFKELWKSLGFSVDWDLQYKTISPSVQKISQHSFLELVNMKKAYIKESPVLWCTECQTSIAQAELDAKDVDSTFNYISFKLENDELIVATTRPELLYGCVCLFINPNDNRYKSYIGKKARVPLYDYEIPIIADDKVSLDKGTGVVMCATFGDSTDLEWYEKHNLPYRKVILPNGRISGEVPFIADLKISDARKEIISILSERNLLLKSENISHTVSVHERCGKEIEIIPSKQWYIDILKDKKLFLEAADKINWHPEHMKNRYISWVENLKWDWCISRQRYFGVPFPVWYCENCGGAVFANYEDLPINPLETQYKGKCSCGCEKFIPESSVFDTWATSSVTPQINARFSEDDGLSDISVPMSVRTQAHEIIRTWAFYTIVKSLYHTGNIPWKDIMICGFVLAKKGEKISKSKNNSDMSPTELIKNNSADVLRYWAANSKLGTDTFFSLDELAIARRFITKIWNASKFSISHMQDINFDNIPELLPVDRWIIEKTNKAVRDASALLNQYEIGLAKHVIDDLFWKDFCDNYLEIVKERLYQPEIHGYEQRRSAQYALYYSLLSILKLYAIFVPHITEYIYQEFFRKHEKEESIHITNWIIKDTIDEDILSFGEELKSIISDMRRYKSENNLSMKAEMENISINTTEKMYDLFRKTQKDIIACSKARTISILTGNRK